MLASEPWYHKPDINFGASAGAKGSTSAKHAGILYHRKFYEVLRLHAAMSLPGCRLLIEPWFQAKSGRRRSPDAVLIDDAAQVALVIEAKMNYKGGRDDKLMDEYLPLVARAFSMKTKPLLVCGSLMGFKGKPLLGMAMLHHAWDWTAGDPVPTLLWTK